MNRTTLKFELDLDFILIAITCPLRDYTLCFKVNRQLDSDFLRIEELELAISPGDEPQYFSRYCYKRPGSECEFYLLANRGNDRFLVPEMRNVDYFLVIRNFIDEEDLANMISGLNKIPEVVVAVEVDPKKLKSKENLIF